MRKDTKKRLLRVISRAIVYDPNSKEILLVRNRGARYWYSPGGGWDHDKESIIKAAEREVLEEAGQKARVKQLLFVREFHEADKISLEIYWLAEAPGGATKHNTGHQDLFGLVGETRWFTRNELKKITVFPEVLRKTFWERLKVAKKLPNPFLGVD